MKGYRCLVALLALALLLSCGMAEEIPISSITVSEAVDAAPDAGEDDRDAEADLREILARMTLGEKVGQLLLVSCHGSGVAQRAARYGVGGLCLYANAFQGKSRDEVRRMISELQDASKVPLLISVDEEGGSVCRVSSNPQLRSARFRAPRALYEAGGWELVESDTAEKAALLLDLGINVNLAPVCDMPLRSSDYIYSRSFGLDAERTAEYVGRVVQIMRARGIGATLKHFPGYGGSGDTHAGMVRDDRPYGAFESADFLPFAAGIAAGAGSVMVSHNVVVCMDPERPASLSPEVHRILREELGFEGVIITDDLQMGAISQYSGERGAVVQALLAGNDLICCSDYKAASAAIFAAIDRGLISTEQIEASALRVLRWKRSLGLI